MAVLRGGSTPSSPTDPADQGAPWPASIRLPPQSKCACRPPEHPACPASSGIRLFRGPSSASVRPTAPRHRTTRCSRARSPRVRGRRAAAVPSADGRAPPPQFPGSLNFDQGEDAEAPEIDFAGAGRTVPWATWYEDTPGAGFGNNNVFASRFDVTQNKWIFAGQDRGTGGGSVMVPSLNIHTDQDAENPSVAGGSAVDPTKPGPWVTWQETTTLPTSGRDQIFVERPIGPGTANCDGVQPAGVTVAGHVPAIGGFCWQQTGIPRVGPGRADPSLNVDPTRNGVEPDIAFTGANDSVPWVVWYEKDSTSISGLQSNEMVFAAKGIPDGVAGNGGFHWMVVGNQLSATLDTSGTHGFGACAQSATTEQQCALNHDATADAEDPRVAAGTMTAGSPTVPWVVWDESVSGIDRIFVSRLVGTGAAAHFEIVNHGAPLATFTHGDTRPDITFSANTPYVTWRADFLGRTRGFVGHFVNPSDRPLCSTNSTCRSRRPPSPT
jgi:hypothetical protein